MEDLKQQLNRLQDEKKGLIERLRETKASFEAEKKLRDENNRAVKDAKEQRAAIFDQVNEIRKKLIEYDKQIDGMASEITSFREIKEEYDQLSWKYQTTSMNITKEKDLVKRIDELEALMEKSKDVRDVRKDHSKLLKQLRKLRSEASVFHQLVTNHAAESEKHHQELVKLHDVREKTEKKLDELSKSIDEMRGKMGESVEEFKKERSEQYEAVKHIKEEARHTQEVKLKDKAKSAKDKRTRGEKMSWEEFVLSQE